MGGTLNERRAVLPGVHTFSLLFLSFSKGEVTWQQGKKKLFQEEIPNRSNGAKKVVPLSVQIESYAPRVGGVRNRPADVEEELRFKRKSRSNKATRHYCTQSTPCDMHLNLVPTVFVAWQCCS